MKQMKFHPLLILCIFTLAICVGGKVVFAENIDPWDDGSQYAYGENIGWLNFEPGFGGGVTVDDTALTGYVWAENIGWINLSPEGQGGVMNDGHGNLSGYAWGENVGWINFDPEHGGVTIDYDDNFDGWAWGENIGWIHFQSAAPVAYKVQTEWQKPIPKWYMDADGDGYGNSDVSIVQPDQPEGYVSNPDDCDDTDPFTYLGAGELCDGKDNDCNGIIPSTEIDNDGDDMAECQGDCDDTDSTVYQGATELCDGKDNDCDGIIPPTETDDDTDGMSECQGDCDDTDPTVFQGATELCDGKDNDCDGFAGTDEVDADGDGYMICAGDCDDINPNVYPGNAKDTYLTYNGDFVVQADDYSVVPPTGEVNLSALLTDSDSQIIEGWEVKFDIFNIEDILVASVITITNSSGIAHIQQDLPVGVYNVDITFTGDDCFYFSTTDSAVIAVYDPTGGFATGGGWYEDVDEVTGEPGRANFGMNVKYKQEASTGNLEFQFQAGDINLKSISIDWLVISETNAQFRGECRINGADGYFFRVIAKDLGEPGVGIDEFDIKIWYGDPDDPASSLVHNSKNLLGGGNIVVHTK